MAELFSDFSKSSGDAPSNCEVGGKNNSCKVSINLNNVFTVSSPVKFMMSRIKVSIILRQGNRSEAPHIECL